MKKQRNIFAENLKHYMLLRGYNQTYMADRIGVAYSTYTDWYHAKSYPKMDKIEKLAEILGVEVMDLIMINPNNPKQVADVVTIAGEFINPDSVQPKEDKRLIHYLKVMDSNPKLKELIDAAESASDDEIDLLIRMINE